MDRRHFYCSELSNEFVAHPRRQMPVIPSLTPKGTVSQYALSTGQPHPREDGYIVHYIFTHESRGSLTHSEYLSDLPTISVSTQVSVTDRILVYFHQNVMRTRHPISVDHTCRFSTGNHHVCIVHPDRL